MTHRPPRPWPSLLAALCLTAACKPQTPAPAPQTPATAAPEAQPEAAKREQQKQRILEALKDIDLTQPSIDPTPTTAQADYRALDAIERDGTAAIGRTGLLPVLAHGVDDTLADLAPCVEREVDALNLNPQPDKPLPRVRRTEWQGHHLRLTFASAQREALAGIDHPHIGFDNFDVRVMRCRWVQFAVTGVKADGVEGRLLAVDPK